MPGTDMGADLQRQAAEALAASPLPALLDSVATVQKAMLATNPPALRRSVGWLGRLLGRDIVMQAEAQALASALGVHLLDARQRLDEVIAYRHRLVPLCHGLQQCAIAAGTDDIANQRAVAAAACRITATHLELTMRNLDSLIARIEALLPQVQILLSQHHMLREDARRGDALAATSSALDALDRFLRDNPPSPQPAGAPAQDRNSP